jgi:hypothetical protein
VPRGGLVAAAGAGPLGRRRQLGLVAVVLMRQPLPLWRLGQALLLAPPAPAPAPGPAPWPPAQMYTRLRPVARPPAFVSPAAGSAPPPPRTAPGCGLSGLGNGCGAERAPPHIAAVPQHPKLLHLSHGMGRLAALQALSEGFLIEQVPQLRPDTVMTRLDPVNFTTFDGTPPINAPSMSSSSSS